MSLDSFGLQWDRLRMMDGGHDPDLTLLYQFARAKTLAAIGGLGPTLAHTRATIATYFDSSGVMQTAGSGVARFDHLPVSPYTSLGLLIEEQRINLCLQSEDFGTTWSNAWGGGTTLSTNAANAPDGNATADEIARVDGNGDGINQPITTETSTKYCISIYAKNVDANITSFQWVSDLASNPTFKVTWTGAVPAQSTATALDSWGIEDVGDGWYRLNFVWESDAVDTSGDFLILPENSGSGTESIYVWGAQMEKGTFPTSYIPTVASAVTRDADDVDTSDVSWYNAGGDGTVYIKSQMDDWSKQQAHFITIFDNGTGANLIMFRNQTNPRTQVKVRSGAADGFFQAIIDGANYSNGSPLELSVAWAANDFAAYSAGGINVTDSSGSVPVNIAALNVGRTELDSLYQNGHIQEIRYYNVRKNNQFLEDLANGALPE